MKSEVRNFLDAMSAAVLMAAVSFQANADSYTFSQTGYSGGGTITGSFDGVDSNNDGAIVSGEVSSFNLSFSGDSMIGSFSHTFSDFYGLVYDANSGFIGDGPIPIEGLASNWHGSIGFDYASGLGPMAGLEMGGRVIDLATGTISSTTELIAVSPVPEVETWAMLVTGLLLVSLKVKRKSA